jgi:3',5'-cyclic AMP phosphodiesterase CpdA
MKTWTRLPPSFAVLVLVMVLAACTPTQKFKYESVPEVAALLKREAATYPPTKFIIISDLHLYDLSLGTEGKAFEDYLAEGRKLLRESVEIMGTTVDAIRNEQAGFVLLPGDLTKDGELVSHELAARYLGEIEAAGKKVYVVPGNHDINNGYAFKFVGDSIERVPSVTPMEFAQIYSQFGYAEALYRDSASLSYMAEPVPGLWLLALDSCRYAENMEDEKPITDGKFNAETMEWIEDMLGRAMRENKAIIVMLHHGIVEHYAGQEKNYGEYIVDDFPAISKLLAMYNARLVFTGHYHAQDITLESYPKAHKFIYDIETGSLVTYPNPYRVASIDTDQKASIRSAYIKSIESHPSDFPDYARRYLQDGIEGIATKAIMGYGVKQEEAERLAKQVAMAFVAHYAGDEDLPPGQEIIQTSGLSLRGWLVITSRKGLVYGLWNDLEPPDSNITINLRTGEWQ